MFGGPLSGPEDSRPAIERAAAEKTKVSALIREIQASGVKSLRGVARALAARGVATERGGAWTPVQVSDILRRGGGPSGWHR